MIVGVGMDLCPIDRAQQMIEKEGFLLRFFDDYERAYLDERGQLRAQTLAGIFAAKEAMLKALGTGLSGISMREVCVHHDAAGRPIAVLSGAASTKLESLGGTQVHLSITHDGGMAAAVAIAEGV